MKLLFKPAPAAFSCFLWNAAKGRKGPPRGQECQPLEMADWTVEDFFLKYYNTVDSFRYVRNYRVWLHGWDLFASIVGNHLIVWDVIAGIINMR